MVATVLSTDVLQSTDFPDNTSGLITPTFVRNLAESAFCIVPSPAGVQTTSYTAAITDRGTCLMMNSSGTAVYTIPQNSSVAFPIGTVLSLMWFGGTTQPSFAAGTGTTIRIPSTLTIRAQFCFASVWQYAANLWIPMGDLTP